MRELEKRRTTFSKTFDLGGRRYRTEVGRSPMHFERGGRLHDIDLTPTILNARGDRKVDKSPYSLVVSGDEPSYAYNSLTGKRVSVELITDARGCVYSDGLYKWGEVGLNTDYVIQALPVGCATLLILRNPDSPKEWSWRVNGDIELIKRLTGRDSAGRILELEETRDSGRIVVKWTGRTTHLSKLRAKRGSKSIWSEEVTWPVIIDPTVNENVVASADDAASVWISEGATFNSFSNNATTILVGRYVTTSASLQFIRFYGGIRFQTIAIPPGATVSSATLTIRATSVAETPNINIYGNNVDDAAVFANPGNRIKNITKTTAVTNKASWTNGADNAITVTSIVAEIIARAGWAQNNDIAFGLFHNSPTTGPGDDVLGFASFDHATLTEPRLSIEYSSGAPVPIFREHYRRMKAA